MIEIRRKQGAADEDLGLEFMHLALGYAATGRVFKARMLLETAVKNLEKNPSDPNLPRVERHLARLYRMMGKRSAAAAMADRARQHSASIAAMDQYNQTPRIGREHKNP
jgi:hypothetical protein